MKFKTKKLKVVAASILLASTLASCCSPAQANNNYENISSVESIETVLADSTQSTMNETQVPIETETNLEDNFTVETSETDNVLLSSGIDLEHYEGAAGDICSDGLNYLNISYGFDNPYSINTLRNITYEYTGIYYENLTLSDVGYFQGVSSRIVPDLYGCNYSYYFNDELMGSYLLCFVRAILIDQGLRFGIDEIPYSYIEQRFPYFLDSIESTGDIPMSLQQTSQYYNISDISQIGCNYDYDALLFGAIEAYNLSRISYIYNNSYGDPNNTSDEILQVRDAITGNNVLVPTEEQYYQMMEDINSIPGCENVDIAVVESRENFYEAYGCYPEDVLNPDMMYEENNMEVYLQNNPNSSRCR